jgi:hypothetical protein
MDNRAFPTERRSFLNEDIMVKVVDKIEFHHTGKKLFETGPTVTTPGALTSLSPGEICGALIRHSQGDWGQLCQEDLEENSRALKRGGRLFSQYESASGRLFWIITECDRSVTTVLLPEEY